jgi:NADH-quinone oxidoreductase subunit N
MTAFILQIFSWRWLTDQVVTLLMPEAVLCLFACFVLVFEIGLKPAQRRWAGYISLAGIGGTAATLWQTYANLGGRATVGFYDMYAVDTFAIVFKVIFLITAAVAIALSIKFLDVENEQRGEYYSLILFATLGMMLMSSGVDILSIFISFELSALTIYVLVAYFKTDKKSNEGAMKYFLLGIFSSGIFLYGLSLLYGVTGETNLTRMATALMGQQTTSFLAVLGMIFIAVSLCFKVAAVPFHMWAPDAYEGAPSSVTAFMSVGAKAAAFAIFARIFVYGLPSLRGTTSVENLGWLSLLAIIAALTMTWGNISAITQSNAKRLMAYSSISHAGFLLLGLIAGNQTGYSGMVIYLFVYVFMNLGAWGVIIALRREKIAGDQVDDFNGLMQTNPLMAVLMTLFLISLAGIPPTAGFVGKYFLFAGLIETGDKWLTTLAVIAVLNTAVSLYYYARFVKAMFMGPVVERTPLAMSPSLNTALIAAAVMVMVIGIYPNPWVNLTRRAAQQLIFTVSQVVGGL